MPEPTGSLHVLNTGAGDITINFNPHDTVERIRAIRMLEDMQRRGYAILVREDDGTYVRALEIDAERGQYVVLEQEEAAPPPTDCDVDVRRGLDEGPPLPAKKRGRPRKVRRDITTSSAVGVARSAGG